MKSLESRVACIRIKKKANSLFVYLMLCSTQKVSCSELCQTIEDCGFEASIIKDGADAGVGDEMDRRVYLEIGGMTCSACSLAVEKALKRLNGVNSAAVSAATGPRS